MNNIPEDVKIYWLDDAARLEATVDTEDDLYAMPVEELRWRLENREQVTQHRWCIINKKEI